MSVTGLRSCRSCAASTRRSLKQRSRASAWCWMMWSARLRPSRCAKHGVSHGRQAKAGAISTSRDSQKRFVRRHHPRTKRMNLFPATRRGSTHRRVRATVSLAREARSGRARSSKGFAVQPPWRRKFGIRPISTSRSGAMAAPNVSTMSGLQICSRMPCRPRAAPNSLTTLTTGSVSNRDGRNPRGKKYVGSATWRTETVSPGSGLAPELQIRANVSIPDRNMTVTWSLRRNADQALPASHTIEIMFNLPPDFTGGGVANIPGVLMKESEQARGVPLAGVGVKATNGLFVIGLSAVDVDVQRNMQLLKDRPWFDVPIVYNNGGRAILALEKGPSGDRAFADAFAAWGE